MQARISPIERKMSTVFNTAECQGPVLSSRFDFDLTELRHLDGLVLDQLWWDAIEINGKARTRARSTAP
jgi:hypothetical protein